MRRVPVVEFEPGAPADELPDGESSHGVCGGAGRGGVVELLRRIDAVTAAAVEAMSSGARRSSPDRSARGGRDHEGGARVAPGGAVGLPAGAGDRGGASGAAGDRLVGRAGRRLAARLHRAGGVRPGARAVDHRVARSRRRRRAADPGPCGAGQARVCVALLGAGRRHRPGPVRWGVGGHRAGAAGRRRDRGAGRCRWSAVGGGPARRGPHPHRRGAGAPGHESTVLAAPRLPEAPRGGPADRAAPRADGDRGTGRHRRAATVARGDREGRVGRAGCRRGWSCAAPPSRPRSPRPTSTSSSPTCTSAVIGWGYVGHPRAICSATSSPGRGM